MQPKSTFVLAVLLTLGLAGLGNAQPPKGKWTVQNSGVSDDLKAVAFADDQVGIAVGHNHTLLKTTDAGKSWRRVLPRDERGAELDQIVYASPKEAWVVAGALKVMLHTTDGGDTWDKVTLPKLKGPFQLSGHHSGVVTCTGSSCFLLASGQSGSHLFRTDNAGKSWTELNNSIKVCIPGQNGFDLAFPTPEHGCFVTRFGIGEFTGYIGVSDDGGKNWNVTKLKPSKLSGGSYMKVRFADKDHGWYIPMSGAIHATTDGGKTWTPQELGHVQSHPLTVLQVRDARTAFVLIGGPPAVERAKDRPAEVRVTTNAGKTWHSLGGLQNPSHIHGMHFPSNRHGWVVGDKGYVEHFQAD